MPYVESKKELVVRSPISNTLLASLKVSDDSKVREMADIARAAQAEWVKHSFNYRLRKLGSLKRYIKRHCYDLLRAVKAETGKPWADGMVDVVSVAAEIHNLQRNGREYVADYPLPHFLLRHKEAEVRYEPHPLVGVISPFNLPLAIPAADIFPAILLGSAVLWKPSEWTPISAFALEQAMLEVGFPAGLVQVVLGYGEAGTSVCNYADYVSFTGSCRTGEKIALSCRQRNVPHNLEMGGKAPAVVLPDANLKRTAYALVYGALSNSGQYCKSFERIYVHRSIFKNLVQMVQQIVSGLEPRRDYGPLITKFQFDIVKDQLEKARADGAEIVCGGRNPGGQWLTPAIVVTDQNSVLVREETFGPVMPFIPFDSEDEAVRLANDSHLGLNASIFTKDRDLFNELAGQIEAGNIVGNDAMINWFIPGAPQCGRKNSTTHESGLKRHGASGLRRFGRPKTVIWHDHPFMHIPLFRNKEPWWMPYNGFSRLALNTFLKAF